MSKRQLVVKGKKGEDFLTALKDSDHDPIKILAMVATGDVVGLGYMTQAEFDAPPEYDCDDLIVRPSGKTIALSMIPPKLRFESAKELARYMYAHMQPKKSLAELEDKITSQVHVYLPDNGRGPTQFLEDGVEVEETEEE